MHLPRHKVQNREQDNEGPHCHQEPRENPRNHPHTEEHEDDILDEHFCLKWQTNINWKRWKEEGKVLSTESSTNQYKAIQSSSSSSLTRTVISHGLLKLKMYIFNRGAFICWGASNLSNYSHLQK